VPDSSGVLAIANMDPGAVTAAALVWPRLVLVDLYESWIRYRPKSSIELARRADVLFLTEQELAAFSPSSQRDIVDAPDKFIVLKRGPQGVTLRYGGQHRQLPAASPERVLSDLGAGDLVLGFVAARLASRVKDDKRIDINDLESAYLEALPWIAQLLESPSPIDFLARQERLQ